MKAEAPRRPSVAARPHLNRKEGDMGTCFACDKNDGWGHVMRTHDDEPVTICITCWRAGCQKCGGEFDKDKHRPVEHRFYGPDGDADEAEIWCMRCHKGYRR